MLAVVDLDADLGVVERESPASQKWAFLYKRHIVAGLQEVPGGREAGQSPSQNGYRPSSGIVGMRLLAHILAVISSFSAVLSPIRPSNTR